MKIKRIVSNNLNSIYFKFRILTRSWRSLPDFIIMGTQKGGTTSLEHYLVKHPDVLSAFRKEIHYFDDGRSEDEKNFSKGIQWYRAMFPLTYMKGEGKLVGDASPLYMFHPLAPSRIAETLPQVKLIILLRNPAERAISHYGHSLRNGNETLGLAAAMEAERERMRIPLEQKKYNHKSFIHHSYQERGKYHEQLERIFKYFKREQVFIETSERFFSDTKSVLSEILDFLELSSSRYYFPDRFDVMHRGKDFASSEEKCVYSQLNDYFKSYNEQLEALLDKDLSWD